MDMQGPLEAVIGFAALYWLLSVACSFFVEALNSFTNQRGRALVWFIKDLAGDFTTAPATAPAPGNDPVWHQILSHPLIAALNKPNFWPAFDTSQPPKNIPPSYISAEIFARALIAVVLKRAGNAAPVNYALLQASIANAKLPETLKNALQPLVDGVNHDIDEARKAIERWYDNVMERASGWYKRYCAAILFVVALGVAFALNIDSFRIGRELLTDPVARATGVRMANAIYQQPDAAQAWLQQGVFLAGLEKRYTELTDGDFKWPEEPEAKAEGSDATHGNTEASKAQKEKEARASQRRELIRQAEELRLTNLRSGGLVSLVGAVDLASDNSAWEEILATAEGVLCPTTARQEGGTSEPKDAAKAPDSSTPSAAPTSTTKPVLVRARCVALLGRGLEMDVDEKGNPTVEGNCPATVGNGKAVSQTPVQLRALFWSDSSVVINPALGCEFERFLTAARTGHGDPATRLDAARKEIQKAKEEAIENTEVARAFLSSLPSIDWVFTVAGDEKWSPGQWVLALLGWLFTALMVSLGAPFWFDLVGKLVNVRGTGEKPSAPG